MPKLRSRKIVGSLLAILFFAFALLGIADRLLPERDPFKAAAISDPAFPSLTYAVQTFLWWDDGDAGKHLDLVRLMSFSHFKQIFAWSDLEPLPGIWDWRQADRILVRGGSA